MTAYFISDLHLSARHPEISTLFLKFLENDAKKADALYILGDFFEAWVGIEEEDPHDIQIMAALKAFSQTGIPVFFIRGNRDFLIDQAFADKTHCQLLPDPTVIELYGNRVVLTHGDQLCTLDIGYQRFRRFVRHPLIQKLFLSLPIRLRRKMAALLRSNASRRPVYSKRNPEPRFEVVQQDVYAILRDNQSSILIHGHTHRQNIHHFILDDKPAKRIVLGDWGTTGNVLVYSQDSITLQSVS